MLDAGMHQRGCLPQSMAVDSGRVIPSANISEAMNPRIGDGDPSILDPERFESAAGFVGIIVAPVLAEGYFERREQPRMRREKGKGAPVGIDGLGGFSLCHEKIAEPAGHRREDGGRHLE